MKIRIKTSKYLKCGLLLIMLVTNACGSGDNRESTADTNPTADRVFTTANTATNGVNALVETKALQTDGDYPSQQRLAQLYDQILPSVVDIEVTATTSSTDAVRAPFFQQPPEQVQGEGTGWVFDDQGHIVTNNHVVENATAITVNFADGSWATGEVVATDPQADLAVVRVTPPDGVTLQPLSLTAPNSLDVGYWVLAFGTPFGLEGTMTLGIVSALGRGFPVGGANGVGNYTLPDVIQTDAAINPGNSGGPLLNLNGEVVGINFAINSTAGSNSGVGFAIPATVVQRIVPALIEQGRYAYPYLGISGGSVTPQLAQAQAVPPNVFGIWVSGVAENGPAAVAGLQAGDIITKINDQPVRSFDELVSYLFNDTTVGQAVTLTFVRNGSTETATVTIQERPATQASASEEQSGATIAIGQAIAIARETVLNADLMQTVDSSAANLADNGGRPVWIVTLQGDNKTANVIIDASTGSVISIDME